MAGPPIFTLRDAELGFGGASLFSEVSFGIARGDRACLIGRNGCGKSTLMKLIAGELELDLGERYAQPGIRIAYLHQDPPGDADALVRDYASRPPDDGPPAPDHAVAAMLDRLELDPGRRMATLSGGESRKAELARVLAVAPDILLLDEPTNHLDLPAIEWLERLLRSYEGAVVTVSHDRRFLASVTDRILWLERGRLRQTGRGFAAFEEWSEAVIAEELRRQEKLDRRIAEETRWLHRGITARRRRNQGRLAALADMRERRAAMLGAPQRARIVLEESEIRSRMAIEAANIAKRYGGRTIVEGFSTRILRGDRIGILGPNGAGKTTLLRMLIGDLKPDSGKVRRSATLQSAYFDQRRASLDPDATLKRTLCPGGGDTVFVRGRPRHVVGYLKDFLFDFDQVESPVGSLSGGERNRLLLAHTLARKCDLLVLDEPTNDLDMDTLDLLADVLGDFEGTLILVSHDRDFLDKTVASVIALEGDGTAREFAGGYSDYRRAGPAAQRRIGDKPRARPAPDRQPRQASKLSFRQQRRWDELPGEIEGARDRVGKLERMLADPGLYERNPERFARAAALLADTRTEIAALEEEWLELALLREELESA
ncbi:MAG: ABC-F family ATP-binding cassette domain-containing protein [Alphaproteobacteria bacterium]|nr:ABC-F family ATP-binding cassette domain-containing protein [Alphaproteobacteria bacterium]